MRPTRALSTRGLASLGLAAALPLAAGAAAMTAVHQSSGLPARSASQATTAPALDHIFVIMLENHSQSSVIDDPNAPYITSLAHGYGMAANYYGVTHPSMPNYLAAIGGSNFGLNNDEDELVTNLDARNLVDQLEAGGKTWAAYMEDLPANKLDRYGPTVTSGGTSTTVPLYAKKHNPFVLFDDVKSSTARMAQVKDYSSFASDMKSGNIANFVWISPNQCHDMHGGVYTKVPGHPETPCPYGSAKDDTNDSALKQKADAFVQQAVSTIMKSKAWTKRSAIFVLTDENDYTGDKTNGGWESTAGCCDSPYVAKGDLHAIPQGGGWTTATSSDGKSVPAGAWNLSPDWPGGTYGGGLIPAIVVTPQGPRKYVSDTPYNHYSMLRTIEDVWGLGHLRNSGDTDGDVVPMFDLLGWSSGS